MKETKFTSIKIKQLTTKLIKTLTFLSLVQLLIFGVVHFLFPYPKKIHYGQVLYSSNNEVIGATLNNEDKWRLYSSLDEVDPLFIDNILHKEDQHFYYHLGVDPLAIIRAFFNNIYSNKRTSGASTISMQVVRLLEPKERTYYNKIIEMFRALQLECTYSKKEILEMYINIIPFGGNIEGIKAATVLYLQKNPGILSPAEACMLSIIPNRPTSLALGKQQDLIVSERNKWLERYYQGGLIDENALESAKVEPINLQRTSIPKIIPHLSRQLTNRFYDESRIKTYININTQLKTQDLVKKYARRLRSIGINNAAAIIIDNHTREVISYVGSQDFFDDKFAGQVDGIQAKRSPGSTLKPLIYGIGFDRGLITPKTKILDVPTDFGNYSPLNYDEKFRGYITVEDALGKSLNIPAVATLEEIGVDHFTNKLITAGFNSIAQQKNRLGLSVALGGCGVTLEELTGLYASLGNKGTYSSLRKSTFDKDSTNYQIISPESNYMIYEILSNLKRPDLPNNPQNSNNAPNIAWKTGTSYGRKDAWSIGYNKEYTVGVWCGNFNNEGSPDLTGAETATPLLFNIFRTLYPTVNSKKEEFEIPDQLFERLVCSSTGLIPEYFCDHTIEDSYIPTVSLTKKCSHRKLYFINPIESFSYCGKCLPKEGGYKKKFYNNYPEQLVRFYNDEKIPFETPPPHNPECKYTISGKPPTISSPVDGRTYYILDHNTELELQAITANDVDYIYWYVNDQYVAKVNIESSFFYQFEVGKNKISCTDDKGRTNEIFIFVN
ncbi:penicillin-binding protein 1C [Flammeovirga agarivorans]|uniref:peptidoglycan glycosyltransferase n=1 Tax=Flammeovirga agarivorans TaxID=2726742 RepID=A0A7X8XVG4_9BACT|nr:penicillin-binding protein 1C [Flammeovirga agarivorans]NLR91322.1 penicillin-binding protein 1C [Flammeovirga agarivorans]